MQSQLTLGNNREKYFKKGEKPVANRAKDWDQVETDEEGNPMGGVVERVRTKKEEKSIPEPDMREVIKLPEKKNEEKDMNKGDRKNEVTVVGGFQGLGDPEMRKRILGEDVPTVSVAAAAPANTTSVDTTPVGTALAPTQEALADAIKTLATDPAANLFPVFAGVIAKMVNKPTINTTPQPRHVFVAQEMEPCPICGYGKPKELNIKSSGEKVRPLVCKKCSDVYNLKYVPDTTKRILAGEDVVALTRHQWILAQLDIARFEEEFMVAKAENDRFNALIEARLKMLSALGSRQKDIDAAKIKLRETPLAREKITAKDAHHHFRRIGNRLAAAREVRPSLEKMIAEETASTNKGKAA
ncbi:MAG: hypothetical protein Q7S70_02505 [bacterium]|nr:hypothetical protein [bacterium]